MDGELRDLQRAVFPEQDNERRVVGKRHQVVLKDNSWLLLLLLSNTAKARQSSCSRQASRVVHIDPEDGAM
jgi:hypothetical protein